MFKWLDHIPIFKIYIILSVFLALVGVATDIWIVTYGILGIFFILAIQYILIQPWLAVKRMEERDPYKRF